MRWPIDRREADDPHAKAGLLLQAHLGRTPLPVSDYFTDTRTVLDNSLRILQVLTLQRPARLDLECRLPAAHPVSSASMGTRTPTHHMQVVAAACHCTQMYVLCCHNEAESLLPTFRQWSTFALRRGGSTQRSTSCTWCRRSCR